MLIINKLNFKAINILIKHYLHLKFAQFYNSYEMQQLDIKYEYKLVMLLLIHDVQFTNKLDERNI